MQRMLVGLLVALTAVVGVIAVMLFQLQDQVESRQSRSTAAARTPAPEGADAERVAKLERRVSGLLSQIEDLRQKQRDTVRAMAKGPVPDSPKGSTDVRIPRTADDLSNASRRADGMQVTELDEAFYLAVKESVDRKARIKNNFNSTMRRFDRFVANGTFQPVEGEDRKKVEQAVLKYVKAADEMVARYIRKPNEQIKALAPAQRREAIKAERDTIVAQAQIDLAVVMGADQAQAVADKMLKNVRRIRPENKRRRRER